MSKSAKRPDVNRTATRRDGDSVDSSSDATVSVDTDLSETGASPSLTKESATADPVDPHAAGSSAADDTVEKKTREKKTRRSKKEKPQKELSERAKRRQTNRAVQVGNPRWFVPLMLGFFIVGLIWIVVFYLTQMAYPIPNLAYWNLVIGFGLLMAGFALTTRWK